MSMVKAFFLKISPQLPWLVGAFMLIGFMLIGLLIYLIARSVTKAKVEVNPDLEKNSHFAGMINEDYLYGEKLPSRVPFSDTLTLKGFFRAGEFSTAFLKALNFLREHLGGRGAEYIFPWYLMLGPSGAGKTSLLDRAGLPLPVGRPDFEGLKEGSHCNWWFFDRNVVLDVQGAFVLHRAGLTSDEKKWQLLLLLLARYRTKRPMDGIILAIPADELTGDSKLEHNEILGRAKQLYQKLCQAQDTLGMRVPVYMMITKCDTILGFKEYASLLPKSHRHQMLGWSSPHGAQDPFEPSWVDQAFQQIDGAFDSLNLEVFASETEERLRENAFQFADMFQGLKEGVSIYANNIFKFSSYRDPFMLRGIYFCGEGDLLPHMDPDVENDHTPYPKISPLRSGDLHSGDQNPLYFARDFLTEKVFREYGLAQPLPARQRSDYRSTLMLRAATLVTLGLCGLGAMHDHNRLWKLKDELLPVLYQMQQILSAEKADDVNGRAHSDQIAMQTQILLKFMSKMHDTSFFSLFLPPSWFSSLHDLIGKTLAVGYDQIIAQSVQDQFSTHFHKIIEGKVPFKTKDGEVGSSPTLVNGGHGATAGTATVAPSAGGGQALVSALTGQTPQFNPVTIPEFKELEAYVAQVIEFEQYLGKYNTLVNSADQSKLSEVTEYLFGFALPKESLEYMRKFKASKHFGGHRPLEIKAYQQEGKRAFKKKYQKYLKSVLSFGPYYSAITGLGDELRKFTSEAHDTLDNIQLANLYRNVTSSISAAVEFMNMPTLDWIEAPVFNPSEPYAALLVELSEKSVLLGPDAAAEMMREAAAAFDYFKKEAILMGTPMSGPFFETSNGALLSKPSEKLDTLKTALSEFFGQGFMGVVGEGTFSTVFSHEKRLIWDLNALARAVFLAESFESFMSSQLQKYPKELRETLGIMGREHLERHINYQLKLAQSFVNAPSVVGVAALEEELRTVVPNFKLASPYLIKIIENLAKNSVAESYIKLRDLVVAEATLVLQTLDHMLDEEKLYAFSGGKFDWWDGSYGAAYKAYSARDDEELKKYFEVQRNRITFLAKEFAEPILNFLASDTLKNADHNFTLVSKWSRILAQLESYNKKKPDNTIITLENYLTTDLNQINYGNCFDKIKNEQLAEHTGDYFEQKRLEVLKAVHERCETTSFEATVQFYKKLSEAFNTKLAGKFPFVSPETLRRASDVAREADPEDLKDFLTLAKDLTPSMAYVMDNDKRLKGSRARVKKFLKQVQDLQDLFQPFMNGEPGQDSPAFLVSADFRVNKDKEIAANQIIEYDAEFGDGQILSLHDVGKTVSWKYGSPLTISLKWAEGGNSLPSADPKQQSLSTHGYSANFYFKNKWSLFMALFSHAAQQGDFGASADASPHVLRFDVPISQGANADGSFPASSSTNKSRVFIRLKVFVPTQGEDKAVAISSMPTFAPPLTQDTPDQDAATVSTLASEGKDGEADQNGDDESGDGEEQSKDLDLSLPDGDGQEEEGSGESE